MVKAVRLATGRRVGAPRGLLGERQRLGSLSAEPEDHRQLSRAPVRPRARLRSRRVEPGGIGELAGAGQIAGHRAHRNWPRHGAATGRHRAEQARRLRARARSARRTSAQGRPAHGPRYHWSCPSASWTQASPAPRCTIRRQPSARPTSGSRRRTTRRAAPPRPPLTGPLSSTARSATSPATAGASGGRGSRPSAASRATASPSPARRPESDGRDGARRGARAISRPAMSMWQPLQDPGWHSWKRTWRIRSRRNASRSSSPFRLPARIASRRRSRELAGWPVDERARSRDRDRRGETAARPSSPRVSEERNPSR